MRTEMAQAGPSMPELKKRYSWQVALAANVCVTLVSAALLRLVPTLRPWKQCKL